MATTKKRINGQVVGGIVGGTFTVAVAGLLLFLNLGPKPQVPRDAEPMAGPETIYVCSGTPVWVERSLSKAQGFWRDHGVKYGDIVRGPCVATCVAKGRLLPCHEGAITISLRDQGFAEEHAGETVRSVREGKTEWATILLPEVVTADIVEPIVDHRTTTVADVVWLPEEAETLVLAHELGHAEGFGHSYTKILGGGGVRAEKSGELMNPKLLRQGWGDGGL